VSREVWSATETLMPIRSRRDAQDRTHGKLTAERPRHSSPLFLVALVAACVLLWRERRLRSAGGQR
jgi:hypothetical protein